MKHVIRSGLVAAIVLVMVASTFAISPMNVNASSTIIIKPDGSVEPASAPIIRHGDGYKLSANVYDSIFIQKSGIKLVGGGYTIQGSGTGFGVYLQSVSNVMLKNLIVKGFDQGIELERSDNNTILRSVVTGCTTNGIRVGGSSNNTIAKNEVYSNIWDGIALMDYIHTPYSDNLITGNKVYDNYVHGIRLDGYHEHQRNIVTKNTVYGQKYGIKIVGNTDTRVEKNLVYKNEYKGIDSVGPINGLVIGNTIRDNYDIGLAIRAGWWTKYEQNMILNNKIGVDFLRGAVGGNVIQHN